MAAPVGRRLIRVEDDGQLTLPSDLCAKLGLKHGGVVSVVETPDGMLIASRAAIEAADIARLEGDLAEQGLTLDDLIDSGREIRDELLREQRQPGA